MDLADYYFGFPGEDDESELNDHEVKDRELVSSLQELSLHAILENFDRFSAAFRICKNKVPKKNWEFLGRRYSETIFEELKNSGKLKSEHLNLLINKHMKKLDIRGIDKKILPDLRERLKEHGSNILTFKAGSHDMDEATVASLMASLRNVEEIDYLYDEFLNNVETVSLKQKLIRFGRLYSTKRFSRIPQIFKAIGGNSHLLKSLTFECFDTNHIKKYNEGIAFIVKNCPYLETLQYRDTVGAMYMLHKSDLKSFRKDSFNTNIKYILKNLASENGYYPLRDALEICATTCPYVSQLHIDYLDNDEELALISSFTNLEEIKFETMGVISSSCLGEFLMLSGSKLITLEMPFKFDLPMDTLIECCPKLQSLRLNYVELPSLHDLNEKPCKASLPGLKTIEFLSTNFSTAGANVALKAILSAAKDIQELSLNGCSGLTNTFFKSLKLCNVRVLDASNSDVTVDSLIDLLLAGNLETLRINYCEKLSHDDYFTLTRCASENNKKVDIDYRPIRSSHWRNFVSCCMAYIP